MLALTASPRLVEIVEMHQVLDVYQDHIRGPLLRMIFGPEIKLPWASAMVDAIALWISLFVAINAFVYRHEEQTLWGHIDRNYCVRKRAGISSALCVLVKYLLTFAATPYVLLATIFSSIRSPHTLFTRCYVTLDPLEIVRYLRFVAMGVAAFFVVLSALSALWQ